MSPSKLGVFASLALAASAVLLPSTMVSDEGGNDNKLPLLAMDRLRRPLVVECPRCPVASQNDQAISWEEGVGSSYVLDFKTGDNQDTLDLSGFQLYPPSLNAATSSFYVTQIDPSTQEYMNLRVTGFESRFHPASTMNEDGLELLEITLKITSLEGKVVSLPEVQINMIKQLDGTLFLLPFLATGPPSEEKAPMHKEEDCKQWPLLCKWKGIVAERIEKMRKMGKGCNKRPHGHGNPMEEDDFHGKPPHRFRPGRPHHHPHHRPHHHGHGGPRHHRIHMFLRRALFTILIPIVIGIFAGTVTYLLGMALGCLIAMIISKVRGQEYQRIALEDDVEEPEVATASRKEDFAELPAYDEPPVYEESDEKQVDETK